LPEGKSFFFYILFDTLFIHFFSRYRSKGYGFVEAATVEDQQKILKEFKEVEFKERLITVKPLLSKGDDE
jgi:RNA recognition motif-containing protein